MWDRFLKNVFYSHFHLLLKVIFTLSHPQLFLFALILFPNIWTSQYAKSQSSYRIWMNEWTLYCIWIFQRCTSTQFTPMLMTMSLCLSTVLLGPTVLMHISSPIWLLHNNPWILQKDYSPTHLFSTGRDLWIHRSIVHLDKVGMKWKLCLSRPTSFPLQWIGLSARQS